MSQRQICPSCLNQSLLVPSFLVTPDRKVTCFSCSSKFKRHVPYWQRLAFAMLSQIIFWGVAAYFFSLADSLGTLIFALLAAIFSGYVVSCIPYRYAQLKLVDSA